MKKRSIWLLGFVLAITIGMTSNAGAEQVKPGSVPRKTVIKIGSTLYNVNIKNVPNPEKHIKEWFDKGDAGALTKIGYLLEHMLFEYTHPTVKVESLTFNYWTLSSLQRESVLFAAIAAGTAPSIIPVGKGSLVDWQKEGIIADLTDYVKKWKIYKDLPKTIWDQISIGGRIYTIPSRYVYTMGITYRKDFFREAGIFNKEGLPAPPDNWRIEDLVSIAQKLTDPKKERFGYQFWGVGGHHEDFLAQYGNFLVKPDPTGKYSWVAFFDPSVKRNLELIKDMKWEKKCALTGVDIDWGKYMQNFFTGKAAMVILDSLSYYAGWYFTGRNDFGPVVDIKKDLGIALPPRGPEGVLPTTVSIESYGVNAAQSKEQIEASAEFIRWSLEEFPQKLRNLMFLETKETGYPVHLKVERPPLYKYPKVEGIPFWKDVIRKDIVEVMEEAISLPALPEDSNYGCPFPSSSILKKLRSVYEAVITNPNTDIEKELDKVADLVNKTLLNYKDETITTENLKTYYTALGNFYKENYPEYYNEWFTKLYEEDLKIW